MLAQRLVDILAAIAAHLGPAHHPARQDQTVAAALVVAIVLLGFLRIARPPVRDHDHDRLDRNGGAEARPAAPAVNHGIIDHRRDRDHLGQTALGRVADHGAVGGRPHPEQAVGAAAVTEAE